MSRFRSLRREEGGGRGGKEEEEEEEEEEEGKGDLQKYKKKTHQSTFLGARLAKFCEIEQTNGSSSIICFALFFPYHFSQITLFGCFQLLLDLWLHWKRKGGRNGERDGERGGGRDGWRERGMEREGDGERNGERGGGREGGRIWCEDTLKAKRPTECGYHHRCND